MFRRRYTMLNTRIGVEIEMTGITRKRTTETLAGFFGTETEGFTITPEWESASTTAIIEAVKMNLGISVLPYRLVKEAHESKSISVFSVANMDFRRRFRIVYRKDREISRNMMDFIKMVKTSAEEKTAHL